MGDIVFNQFPVNFQVPGTYVEFDPSQLQQGVTILPQSLLLIGQMLVSGVATAGVITQVTSPDDAGKQAGRGSMLHQMAIAAFAAAADAVTISILPLADAGAATKADRVLTITGPATNGGTLALYVGGRRYPVTVALNDSANSIATNIAAAISADDLRLVDAVATTDTVTLTARNAGVAAGDCPVMLNRYLGELLPAGVGVAIGALTAGTGDPLMSATIADLGDQWFTTFAQPYTATADLTAFAAELLRRNGPIPQIEGFSFSPVNAAVSAEIADAAAINSPFISLMDANDCLAPGYAFAAACAGAASASAQTDPGLPAQTLPLPGLLSVLPGNRRKIDDRQSLLMGGVGTVVVDSSGTIRVQRLATTYRTNEFGAQDLTQFDVNVFRLWAQTRYTLRQIFQGQYGRYKLGQDGSRGPDVMTPKLGKSVCVAMYSDFVDRGWYESGDAFTQFKADLSAAIDSNNPNRLNLLFPPNFINQLRVTAVLVQPRQ